MERMAAAMTGSVVLSAEGVGNLRKGLGEYDRAGAAVVGWLPNP